MLAIISTVVILILLFVLLSRDSIEPQIVLPWFLLLFSVGFFSSNENYILFLADLTGIKYPPLAIILLILFLVICLSLSLAVFLTRLLRVQKKIIAEMATQNLERQFLELRMGSKEGVD
tara:strand:+ start:1274 stop:1630 length:357 start_codon:yes stop_codon:yes gene_type:complete